MKILWTEPAVGSLEAIHEFIARDSEFNASRFIEKILIAVEMLIDQPEIGRKVPEADRMDIREIIFQSYRIIHRVESHTIQILSVIHGRINLSELKTKPWDVE